MVRPEKMGVFNLSATLSTKQGHEITLPIAVTVLDFLYYPISKVFNIVQQFYGIFTDVYETPDAEEYLKTIEIYDFDYFLLESKHALTLLNHIKETNIRHGGLLSEEDLRQIEEIISGFNELMTLIKQKNRNADKYEPILNKCEKALCDDRILSFINHRYH